jgi:hypothetical protein
MKIHSIVGGGGVKLHVREWGKADAPPVLFIHGWSQNYLCWRKQYESQLADAFRLVAPSIFAATACRKRPRHRNTIRNPNPGRMTLPLSSIS